MHSIPTVLSRSNIIPCSIPVLIVLNEIFFHLIFHRCCSCLISIRKFFLGQMIQIATFLALTLFEIHSRQAYFKANGHNATVSCVFYLDQALATTFNYNWMVLPDCLFVLSHTLMIIGGLEFNFFSSFICNERNNTWSRIPLSSI